MASQPGSSGYRAPEVESVIDDGSEISPHVAHIYLPSPPVSSVDRHVSFVGRPPPAPLPPLDGSIGLQTQHLPEPSVGLRRDLSIRQSANDQYDHHSIPEPSQGRPHSARDLGKQPAQEARRSNSSTEQGRRASFGPGSLARDQRRHHERAEERRPYTDAAQDANLRPRPRARSYERLRVPELDIPGPAREYQAPSNRSVAPRRRRPSQVSPSSDQYGDPTQLDDRQVYAPQPQRPWSGARSVDKWQSLTFETTSRLTTPLSRRRRRSSAAATDTLYDTRQAPRPEQVGSEGYATPPRRSRRPSGNDYSSSRRHPASGSSTPGTAESSGHHRRRNSTTSGRPRPPQEQLGEPYSRGPSPTSYGGGDVSTSRLLPSQRVAPSSYVLPADYRTSYRRGSVSIPGTPSTPMYDPTVPPLNPEHGGLRRSSPNTEEGSFFADLRARFDRPTAFAPPGPFANVQSYQTEGPVYEARASPRPQQAPQGYSQARQPPPLRRWSGSNRLHGYVGPPYPSRGPEARPTLPNRQELSSLEQAIEPNSGHLSRRNSPRLHHVSDRLPYDFPMAATGSPLSASDQASLTEGFPSSKAQASLEEIKDIALKNTGDLGKSSSQTLGTLIHQIIQIDRAIMSLHQLEREYDRYTNSRSHNPEKPDGALTNFREWVGQTIQSLEAETKGLEALASTGASVRLGQEREGDSSISQDPSISLNEAERDDLWALWECLSRQCQEKQRELAPTLVLDESHTDSGKVLSPGHRHGHSSSSMSSPRLNLQAERDSSSPRERPTVVPTLRVTAPDK